MSAGGAQVREMNSAIEGTSGENKGQTSARKGLGLETTNQRSVSSISDDASGVLTKPPGLHPQAIADAGVKVSARLYCSTLPSLP